MNGRHMSAAYATPFNHSAPAAAGAARTPSHALRPVILKVTEPFSEPTNEASVHRTAAD